MNYKLGKALLGSIISQLGRSYNISQDTSYTSICRPKTIEFSSYFQYGVLENSILFRAKVGYSSNTNEVYEQGDKLDF